MVVGVTRPTGAATGEAANYREKALEQFGGFCERCGDPLEEDEMDVHHVDRDRSNDNLDNLECVCHECHVDAHEGDDPLLRVVCSMPRPVLELLDEAVERNGYASRSEAINRAVVDTFEPESVKAFGGPVESVSSWFADDRHTRWVSDAVVEGRPDSAGGSGSDESSG